MRRAYADDYFAAHVLDPDGNNVEAVAHEAEKPVYYIGSYDIADAASFAQYPPVCWHNISMVLAREFGQSSENY